MRPSADQFQVDPPEPTHPSELTLDRWEYGELSDESAAEIKNHVDGCPYCQARIVDRRSLDTSYRRVRRQRRVRRGSILVLATAAGVGAVALLFGQTVGPPLELREVRGHIANTMGTTQGGSPAAGLTVGAASRMEFLVAPTDGGNSVIAIEIVGPNGTLHRAAGRVDRKQIGESWLISSDGQALFGVAPGVYRLRVRARSSRWGRAGPPLDIVVDYLGVSSPKDGNGPHNTNAE